MRTTILTVFLALMLVALAVNAAPSARNGSSALAASPGAQAQSGPQPRIQVFTGTILKTGDQFLLSQDKTKASYQLDDQQTASKFDGQKVRVTGILDATNNIIRVQSIQPSTA
jgi:uncharacterized protein DUF5818